MRYELEKRILFETGLLELAQRLAKFREDGKKEGKHTKESKPKASATATQVTTKEVPGTEEPIGEMVFPGAKESDKPAKPSPTPAKEKNTNKASIGHAPLVEETLDINDPLADWERLLWVVAQASVAKAVLLSKGKPISFTDDVLRIEYPPENALIGGGLNDPLIKDETERILSDLLEKPVLLEIEFKHRAEKGSQAGLFEGEIDPEVSELKGIIESEVLKRVSTARIQRIEKVDG
jgi:hypothetical protein